MKLDGIAVLVTGGSQGIGKAVAEAFLQKQAKVCIADVREDDGKKAAEELGLAYGLENVIFRKCDVTSDEDFESVVTSVKSKFGRFDVLVNNAGIGSNNLKDWSKIIDVNLKGVMRGTLLAYDHLVDGQGNKGGMVINMGSITGLKPSPFGSSYCASKCGIVGWTKSVGHKWNADETGVKVNVVCPKAVDTEMMKSTQQMTAKNPQMEQYLKGVTSSRMLEPSKVAEAVLQVLEDDVTGAVLVVGVDELYYVTDDKK